MKKWKQKNTVPFQRDAEFYFRVGMKYADKKAFQKAFRYIDKAVAAEPMNPDYQFNLGCVLAELKQSEKSNKVLEDIIKYLDPTFTECYFGIGCNYFDLGDFKKAREAFEKYVYYDPEGEFIEEAHDILYYLQIYDDVGQGSRNARLIGRLAAEGRKLMRDAKFTAAVQKLEKALEMDPENIDIRNDLSRTYFLAGSDEKAIQLANTVVRLEPENIYANCNLAVYYFKSGDREQYVRQLRELTKLEIRGEDQLIKLMDTLLTLDEQECLRKIICGFVKSRSLAEDILRRIRSGTENGMDVGAAFKAACDAKEHRLFVKGYQKDAPQNVSETGLRKMVWKKEWQAVIDCAIKNKESVYKGTYKDELKNIWMNFIKKVYPEKEPQIKKSESWAATLEYIYCNVHLIRVSKKKLAEKYKISPSSITNHLKDFF